MLIVLLRPMFTRSVSLFERFLGCHLEGCIYRDPCLSTAEVLSPDVNIYGRLLL